MRRKGLLTFITSITVLLIVSFISADEMVQRIRLKGAYLDGVFPQEDPSFYRLRGVLKSHDLPWFTIRVNRIPETREYLAIEKGGTIMRFSWDDPESTRVVLDMKDVIMAKGESGILDIAFHPQFNNETSKHYREVYIVYNYAFDPSDEQRNFLRLSRFYFEEDLGSILRSSEEILIQQFAQNPNHNAGKLFFDQDEYLFFTVGDEGGAYDQYRNGQMLSRELFAGILRIDVNNDSTRSHPIRRQPIQPQSLPAGYPPNFTRNYLIPNDNPFVDESGKYLEEFYVIGLRNPFTASLDTVSGGIWVGDVGQEQQEEISLVFKGSNAQWPYMEGNTRHDETPNPLHGIETPPLITHSRAEAKSIICGLVYRGENLPKLRDKLIYGDFITGNIWSYDITSGESTVLTLGGKQVLQFFEGPDDELYLLALGGELYGLEAPIATDVPELLSETGAFKDLNNLTPSDGIVPYEVNAPLWSDGAEKYRWIAVSEGREVQFDKKDHWAFRAGTVFIKHFEIDTGMGDPRRLETRFLIKDSRGTAYGLSYKWDAEGTDARLIGAVEAPVDTLEFLDGSKRAWNYPTRSQCLQCHTDDAGFVLGVKTAQLNGPIHWEGESHGNQVALWQDLGLFANRPDLKDIPKMVALGDSTVSSLTRFKSYLDANCASCHRPEGVAPQFDARFSTPIEEQELVFKEAEGFNSIPTNHLITPGDTLTSELFRRDVEDSASWKMPPLARNMVDTSYINFLKTFIIDLGASVEYIHDTICQGETYFFRDSTYRVIEENLYDSVRFTGAFGLDSLVIYDLVALPEQTLLIRDSVCFGGSYELPSGEVVSDITSTLNDSSWVRSLEGCNLVISEVLVKDPNIPCEVLPLEITIGPNPVDFDYFTLASSLEIEAISLVDFFGKPVNLAEVVDLGNGQYEVVLSASIRNGLYLLKVQAGEQEQTIKIVVDR